MIRILGQHGVTQSENGGGRGVDVETDGVAEGQREGGKEGEEGERQEEGWRG